MFPIASLILLLFSHSVVSDSLQAHRLQHTRLPCPSLSPRVCSNSCPLSRWCHPTISFSVAPFSSYPQSLPASGSFPVSQLFTSVGQSIGVSASASVLLMNIHYWFPLGLTSLISLQSKGLSRVFSTVQFSSVAQSCPTLCDPMNCSTPGLPVHHQLPEFTQTHVPRVSDAIQPSHPLSSPSPPAFNLSQHQGLSNESIDLVQFSCSVVSDSFRPHELQHARPPCPSPTP